MFKSCPLLKPFESKTKQIYEAFTAYKQQIPTCGAMILNPTCTKVLLVRSYNGKSWGFPKGKIDKDEDKPTCAAREVLEEVGYDITERLDPDAFIEMQWKDQTIRLYLVAGVPEDTVFITRTKKEIGEIAWHKIKELPASKADTEKSDDKKKFWMVAPLVARLRNYLAQKQQKNKLLKGQVLKKPKNAAAPAPSAEPPYAQPAASEPPPGLQGAAAASVPLGTKSGKGKGKQKAADAPSAEPPKQPSSRGHAFLDFAFDKRRILDVTRESAASGPVLGAPRGLAACAGSRSVFRATTVYAYTYFCMK